MGERKSHGGAEGDAAASTNSGGPYSAFDFNDDDMRVEDEERKAMAKYAKSPSKKRTRRRKSLEKYDFLRVFAGGASSKQNSSANDELGDGPTDIVSQDRTRETGFGMSVGLFSYESAPFSSPECTSEVKSSLAGRKPGCHTAGKKHNQVLHLDSDDDEILESTTIGSPVNMGEKEGSLKEQSSKLGANSNNCEAMVVLAPQYVKRGNDYYINCRLTFSQRFIRLDASPLCDRNRKYGVEWPTSDILDIEHQQCESDKAEVVILYLRCEVGNADETGKVKVEFVIRDDPQWSQKQEEIRSLALKYGASWKTIVTEYCFEESFEEVVYPDGDPDAVIISRRDIELLQPRTFINDTIIDFYIRYLFTKTKAEKQHRFHFFNTFFFQKLAAAKQQSSKGCGERDAFQSVLKWTRNVNLFEKDYIFIPVNFSLHWSLLIICHPGEVAYLNKDMDESYKVPCILHMDSIRGMHEGSGKLIRSYLWQEWKERGNDQGNEIKEKFSRLNFVQLQVPQQENLFDCGLFLLHYAELFLELASECSTTISIDYLNEAWFLPAEVSLKKRNDIKKLIHKLSQDNAQKDPPSSSNKKYLEKNGRRVDESSSRSVLEVSGKEFYGTNFDSVDNSDAPRQQCFAPMRKQRNNTKDLDQPRTLRVQINLFNDLTVPMEEASGEQTTVPPGDTRSECKADELMPPCELNCFTAGEASRSCSNESAVTPLALRREEDCASEVGFPTETLKQRDEDPPMAIEDLAACVVEDSEDETQVTSIRRRTKRSRPS